MHSLRTSDIHVLRAFFVRVSMKGLAKFGATAFPLCVLFAAFLAGCGGGKAGERDTAAEAPPPVQVENAGDPSHVSVDHPEQFPLVAAGEYQSASELTATGVVTPDISRTVPVISIASGRVVDIRARLGDAVHKGQVLLRVQSSDISGAFSDYQKAVADELLANKQYDRAKGLYDHGAISLNDFQIAEDAENKAKVDVETAKQKLKVYGSSVDHPSGIVDIVAPISGVITDQQVTNASGVQGLSAANPFTISDLSKVWIVCDVYENDVADVHIGDTADVRLNAYPTRVIKGKVSNIGAVLDPALRTAKVRIEVKNDGELRPGMFATATFKGQKKETYATVPASAILHLHDHDWVYVPDGRGKFRRVEVVAGASLPDKTQEIKSGLKVGDQVVRDALVLQNTVEQ
jgi:membrane fusion protein, heavy metal efflux system